MKDHIDLRYMNRGASRDLKFMPKQRRPLICFLPRLGWRRTRVG